MGSWGSGGWGLLLSPTGAYECGSVPSSPGGGMGVPFYPSLCSRGERRTAFWGGSELCCSQEKRGVLIPPSVVQAEAEFVQPQPFCT